MWHPILNHLSSTFPKMETALIESNKSIRNRYKESLYSVDWFSIFELPIIYILHLSYFQVGDRDKYHSIQWMRCKMLLVDYPKDALYFFE